MQFIDAEKLKNLWWASPPSPLPLDAIEWIEKTYLSPKTFWESIFTLQKNIPGLPPKSVLGQQYDFYFDCVARHIESNQAFTIIENGSFVQNWTYRKLHRCINFQVKHWMKHSLKPTQMVVILAPVGIHFFIALLTALRLGLTICYLPTNSPYLPKSRIASILAELQPQLVVARKADQPFVTTQLPTILLDEFNEDDQNHYPPSHDYASNKVMQIALSLYRQEALTLVPLDAHTTYTHALREGLLALNLKQGITWASPLSCPIRSEPFSTLAALLCGAAVMHIPDEVIKNDPQALKDEKVHLLGVSSPLQQLWSRDPAVPIKHLKAYYKQPLDMNFEAWKGFSSLNKLEKVPAFHLLMDNSMGGVTLFSKPTLDNLDLYLKPNVGTPFSLMDIHDNEEPSFSGYGIFKPHLSCEENTKKTSNFYLAQLENNHILSYTITPCRDGVAFPIDRVEAIVNQASFVEACMLHHIPKLLSVCNHQFSLLVFVNPLKNEISEKMKEGWTQELFQQIESEAGPGFLPDRVEYFPLLPKLKNGTINRKWCADQCNQGLLARKKNMQIFQVISALKKLILESV